MTRKARARSHTDKAREKRITWEILVDAYTPIEQAMGWYYYLENALQFPFTARCVVKRAISPLKKGDEVEVIGMAPEEECEHEMFVRHRVWANRWSVQAYPVTIRDEQLLMSLS